MKSLDAIFRKEKETYLIEVRLANLKQFFNSFDPSPFHDKDIDDDAERYIVESVRAFSLKTKLKLVFYLPQEHNNEASRVLTYAIDNYFDYRATTATKELYSTLREGRTSMMFGLLFLFICIGIRSAFGSLSDQPFGNIILEGLSIVGWVAMWRPIQIFLYEWWAIYRRKKIFEKIRDMPVEIIVD